MNKKLTPKAKLDTISNILFPKLEVKTLSEGLTDQKEDVRVLVDSSVIANLLSCLNDLKDSKNDEVVWKSLESTLEKLEEVKRLIQPDVMPNEDITDINYMIVDFR